MRRQIVAEFHALRDTTARLDERTAELERSNIELEQFAYVASHDLQEPLRKVASFTQLLERRYKGQLDERADQYIAFAVDGAKRMQGLINDLLAFSRVGRLTREHAEVGADELVDQAVANLSIAIEESDATVTVAEDMPRVSVDVALLVGVFQNLIGNALKFRWRAAAADHRVLGRRRRPVGVLGRRQRDRDRAGVCRPDLRDLPAAAPEGRLSRHRHRAGHVPEDHRIPRRADLAGHLGGQRDRLPFHAAEDRSATRTGRVGDR
jgi:nitrogen-specific signal transduction histidine kinase